MSTSILPDYQKAYWLIMAIMFLFFSLQAMAEDLGGSAVTAGVETETNSRYLWRGLIFSDGAVQQSTLWVTLADITVSIWSNHDLKSRSTNWGLNEVDLSLTYSASLKNIGIESTLIYYGYPYQSDSPGTAEIGLKISHAVDLVEVFTNHTLDIDEYAHAYYGEVGLAYQLIPSERSLVEMVATFGWASNQFAAVYAGDAPDRFLLATFTASVDYRFSARFYARPHMAYSSILSKAYDAATGDRDHWQLGFAVGAEL